VLRLQNLRVSAFTRASSLVFALAVLGCGGVEGPHREPVQGTVNLDGEPLEKGLITFSPLAGGDLVVSALIVDGAFSLPREDGPGLGAHRVDVWSKKATGKTLKNPDDPEDPIEERIEIIPPRYNLDSQLGADVVQGGENRFTDVLVGAVKKVASRRVAPE